MTIEIEVRPQEYALLGRQKVHDERSRSFAMNLTVDRTTWRSKSIRLYEPLPNPNQTVGCCTGVAKCSQFNAVGNRLTGKVLNLDDAMRIYTRNTEIDPFPGTFPEYDTGSSGLASCKTAVEFGMGGEYRWLFGGADEVVQAVMAGEVISVGTWWYDSMFHQSTIGVVKPIGNQVGGHQYVVRGYDAERDLVLCRCWWGHYRDFWMTRGDLDYLLRDGGDAHFQKRGSL